MAEIPVRPHVLTDAEFTLALETAVAGVFGTAAEYQAHVSRAEFVPTSQTITWKGLSRSARFTGTTSPTWVLGLAMAQDWLTNESLSEFLLENEGKRAQAVLRPYGDPVPGDPVFTAVVLLTPGGIGGTVDAVSVGTLNLGVDGKPDLTRVGP